MVKNLKCVQLKNLKTLSHLKTISTAILRFNVFTSIIVNDSLN